MSKTMADTNSPLLVPIAAEALVVNHVVQTDVPFSRWEMEYQNLDSFESPTPPPFSNVSGTPPDPGVHLHWAMPRALTRGMQVQAAAVAQVSDGKVTGITVTNGGYAYTDALPPMIMVSGGGGHGALASAVVANGFVIGVTLIDPGSGYASPPDVSIAPSDSVAFPLVPNRWLVVRYGPAPAPAQPRPTIAWLLQSDAIDANADPLQSNSFVNPFPTNPGAAEATRLGTKAVVLQSWGGESSSPASLFLRALGPGEATFSAYQPGVVNVFSFFDPISAPGAGWSDPKAQQEAAGFGENTALSYLVVGWYSDPTHDPIYGPVTGWDAQGLPVRSPWSGEGDPAAAWTDLLDTLNWSVQADSDAGSALPSHSLYHALVYGVNWQTTALPPRPNSSMDNMTVAVGNTSIDALAAIVSQMEGAPDAERLEAFQYNFLPLLDAADGHAQLDIRIRQAAFGSVPGGTHWQVIGAGAGAASAGELDPGVLPPPPPLTPAQGAALASLNGQQRDLDENRRLLTSLQWELYATWWKKNRLARMSVAEQGVVNGYLSDVPTPITNLAILQTIIDDNLRQGNASGLLQRVVQLQQKVRAAASALPVPTNPESVLGYATNVLKLDPAALALKGAAMPRFYQPADPVVLVAGIETSEKQGGLTDKDALPCRLLSQAVSGVNVTRDGHSIPVTAATAGMTGVIPAAPANPHLPPAVAAGLVALNIETFFVDAGDAAAIVTVGLNSDDQPTIDALGIAMRAGAAQISTIAAPLAARFAFAGWTEQAWSPLYMEWDVSFYPTVLGEQMENESDWPFSTISSVLPTQQPSDTWGFNGTNFDWYGVLPPNSQNYIGRTFLTPQSTHVLIGRLQKYLKEHPDADLQAVEALIEKIGEWNFLSQRLSGLLDQFIMRDLSPSQPPDASVAAMVAEQYHAFPDPSKGEQDLSFGNGYPFFFPVRGGFFKFNRLNVVDAFGQVIDLMLAGGNVGTGVAFAPIRGRGLSPLSTTTLGNHLELVQFAPRLVQTSRLNFRFVSAIDDTEDTELYPDASPVCGWVLPNHLDGGLMVYDATGDALGELLVLADSKERLDVRWLPAPDAGTAVADPATIANIHLRAFVVVLTASTDQGAGFQDLLKAIDETLWTVDPLGARTDQNLSVLIGRPLALVRARLQFELDGAPVCNQSWGETLQEASAGVGKTRFPIRLGSLDLYDDGLMGYFEDDTYTTFNSVHQPDGFVPAQGAYLNPVGYNGNYLHLPFDYPRYSSKYVTLLLDPRGDVHAHTGVLPTKVVSVPAAYVDAALARMAVTVRTGPVLTDALAVTIPAPAELNGEWSWVQRTTPVPSGWTNADWTNPAGWTTGPIVNADPQARSPDAPPRLLEGWLKLTPNEIER